MEGKASRKECRQSGLYIASFEPAEGRLQKLVHIDSNIIQKQIYWIFLKKESKKLILDYKTYRKYVGDH